MNLDDLREVLHAFDLNANVVARVAQAMEIRAALAQLAIHETKARADFDAEIHRITENRAVWQGQCGHIWVDQGRVVAEDDRQVDCAICGKVRE